MDIDKYTINGKIQLSSGLKTDQYYNFEKITPEDKLKIAELLKREFLIAKDIFEDLVIISIGKIGMAITQLIQDKIIVYHYNPELKTIIDGRVKAPYIIFTDVIKTFSTILDCIKEVQKNYDYEPIKIICIKNALDIIDLSEEYE